MPSVAEETQGAAVSVAGPASPHQPSDDEESSILVEGGGEAGEVGGKAAANGAAAGAADAREEGGGDWQTVGEKPAKASKALFSSVVAGDGGDGTASAAVVNAAAGSASPSASAAAAEEEDEDNSEDEEDEDGETEIQLGFAEPVEADMAGRLLFQDPNWHDWDGGKIGGKPIWLNPRDLPARSTLDCAGCGDPLCFILQIYCPLDDPPHAFHRVLYVFCCRKPRCTGPGCAKVLRCQLPRENAFYAYEPKKVRKGEAYPWEALVARTCDVCGQGADKACAGCKKARYCSRVHQREGWKAGHKLQCTGGGAGAGAAAGGAAEEEEEEEDEEKGEADAAAGGDAGEEEEGEGGSGVDAERLRSVFPEFEIVIEEESPRDEKSAEERKREDEALLRKYQDVYVAEAGDEDARVGQKELDKAVGANPALKDRQSLRFLATIGREPDQVLRYARWDDSAPLWVAAAGQPRRGDVPACPRCGAARAFEFQVMPQLLHYLRVDAKATLPGKPGPGGVCRLGAMDWGTLAVYTCTGSCAAGTVEGEGAYVEEFLWRQAPMG